MEKRKPLGKAEATWKSGSHLEKRKPLGKAEATRKSGLEKRARKALRNVDWQGVLETMKPDVTTVSEGRDSL
ncbi:hypothetical protein ACU19_02705 [Actinobaculum suis]|nr:hypothetical protein ACU19_02705 [Actinobaculum suis]